MAPNLAFESLSNHKQAIHSKISVDQSANNTFNI